MSESMVERVAYAIIHELRDCLSQENYKAMAIHRVTEQSLARAAIAAMREPTVIMDSTGHMKMEHLTCSLMEASVASDIWRAMIDAALSEQSNG